MADMGRAFLLHSAGSRRRRGQSLAETVAAGLRERGWRVDGPHRTAVDGQRGDAAGLALEAAQSGADLVVVVGGDGTLRQVVSALGEDARGLAVGLVPAGNANVVAQEFGLSGKLHSVLEVLDRGEDRALDALCVQADRRELGRALAMVGVGWEGRTARWVGWTRSLAGVGRIYRNALGADGLYLACGLAAMVRLGLPRLAIEVDGEPLAGSFADVEVSNVATYAKRMRLCPDARADDGWLDLQLRRHGFPPTVAAALACAGVGARAPRFLAQLHRARRVRVVSDSDFEWQLDGDFAGQSRELEVSVLPQSWLLRVPSTPRCPHARETVAGT